jgi:hypothetical protein
MKNKIKKGLEKILAGGIIAVGGLIGSARAGPGIVTTENNLNSTQRHVHVYRDNVNFSGATDGYDNGYDSSSLSNPNGFPNCYSDITTHNLWSDFRDENSVTPYNVKLGFEGGLGSDQPNWIEFSFPYSVNPFTGTGDYTFGSKPITFQSNRLPYGVVDVRKAVSQSGGIVDLIDVPSGSYNQWVPYGEGVLEIGTRHLADLNDDNIVNMGDFALMNKDWMKSQGKYVGDISGPNGIPDGYVNNLDLIALNEEWLSQSP